MKLQRQNTAMRQEMTGPTRRSCDPKNDSHDALGRFLNSVLNFATGLEPC